VGLVGTLSRVVTVPLLGAWVLSRGRKLRRLWPGRAWGGLLVMGLISIAINILWFSSVWWTPATNVAMLMRLDLIFVVLIGAAFGLERMGRAQLALVPLMFVGLALLSEIQELDFTGHLVGDLMAVAAALGLAANAFIIRHILRTMDEEAVALYNHAISMLGFVGLALVMGDFGRTGEMLARPGVLLPVAVVGVVAAVGLPLYYVALARMEVWRLRMFMLSTPVITAAVEWPLWGVRLAPLQWLGAAIILGGLAVLIRIEGSGEGKGGGANLRERPETRLAPVGPVASSPAATKAGASGPSS
jgi:drug/metabolite transporter (DMT)-like permease